MYNTTPKYIISKFEGGKREGEGEREREREIKAQYLLVWDYQVFVWKFFVGGGGTHKAREARVCNLLHESCK